MATEVKASSQFEPLTNLVCNADGVWRDPAAHYSTLDVRSAGESEKFVRVGIVSNVEFEPTKENLGGFYMPRAWINELKKRNK